MLKKLKYIVIMIIVLSFILTINSFARITSTDPTVNSGETVTITISSQEPVASGAIDIASNSGLTFKSVTGGTANGTRVAFAKTENATSGLATYTFEAPTVTSDTTYTVKFTSEDFANADGEDIDASSATATVTVKAPEQQTNNNTNEGGNTNTGSGEENNTNNNTGSNEEQEETIGRITDPEEEPNFTDVDKTMYSTSKSSKTINLRDSWSTSSKATSIDVGTELQVTGTSTNEVNGYVWYRVVYDGKTKYIASSLLTSTKPEEKIEEEKSNNANLKALTIEGYTTKPTFKASTLSYTLEVANDVNELTINAEADDSKAKVSIDGNKDFKEGENKVTITVKAEDGTEKTYELSVTKAKGVVLGLKVLKIKDTDMEKTFKTSVFSYKINIGNVDKLEIEAVPTIDTATVEILGNENLQDGENTITIMVKSEDGKETKTYQIVANKNVAIATENENKDNGFQLDGRVYLYGGICILALILLIILIVRLIRNKAKNKHDDDPDDGNLYDYDKYNKKDEMKNEFSNDFNETPRTTFEPEDKKEYGSFDDEKIDDEFEEEYKTEEEPKTYYKEDQYSPDEEEDYETGISEEDAKDSYIEKNYDTKTQEELEKDIEEQFGTLYNNESDEDEKPKRRGKHF